MICKNCYYDPVHDISPVDQFGYVNIIESLENGVVPSSISNTELDYNEIEEPCSIIGKPSDIFEAYRLHDNIRLKGKKAELTE